MRILAIHPILEREGYDELTRKILSKVAFQGTEIDVVSLERGPASIESAYDEALAVPEVLKIVVKAERQGYDAVVILCMGDPGVAPARELVEIPVVGPCQASLTIASTLGERCSILTILREAVPTFWRLARRYGFEGHLASVRSIEIPVLKLWDDRDAVFRALAREGRLAIEEDGADVLILGCTGMMDLGERLQQQLGVPVVDPALAALKYAELLVSLNLSHRRVALSEG
ncbi:MAG: aspartate/glutamate racemase family protein [Candidatus Verstraetearchaeota archaeon]|nr:aspartate/glutamate racemase family protein [Candidatus Verstraetearchaeota archaeon]